MEDKDKSKIKATYEICEILEAKGIPFNLTFCNNCNSYHITVSCEKNKCCSPSIIVQSCRKDTLYRIYPEEIIYIAIEQRKSVLYLTDKVIETNYPMSHWSDILDNQVFVQSHYSYIVNLNYVSDVTKDFVILKHCDKEYPIYIASRKRSAFKKSLTEFYEKTQGENGTETKI